LTVLFSSHLIADLERVCDHLVLLREGQVALTGDIETLLAEHRVMVGPRSPGPDAALPGVIEAAHSDRHTTLLVRHAGAVPAPGWQTQPVPLEDLVLAYLRRGPRPVPHPMEVPA